MRESINSAFDALMRPMLDWSPEWSCALISAAIGVLLLVPFKYLSPQKAMERVKDRMWACVLGGWVFRDQPRMIANCQRRSVVYGFTYLVLSLFPLAVMALPMIVLFAQMDEYYSRRPLTPGQTTQVRLVFADGVPIEQRQAALGVPDGISLLATNMDPQRGEAIWRVEGAQSNPRAVLELIVAGQKFEKQIGVGSGMTRVSAARMPAGFLNAIWWPGEPGLPADGPVASISVDYPPRELRLLRWNLEWYWSSFAVMFLSVLVFRKPLGVTI